MNILQYQLKLSDLFSAPLRKAASLGEASLGKVSQAVTKVQNKFAGMGSAATSATNKISTASNRATTSLTSLEIKLNTLTKERNLSMNINDIRRANRAIEETENRMQRLQNIGRRNAGGGLGIGGLLAGGGVVAGITSSLQAGFSAQAQSTSFEVMAGVKEGGKLFQDLTKFAQDSIFGNELYKNAQTLKAFGVETQKVMPTLRMLGDVSMGNKERLGALSLAFAQVKSAGKLTGQDLLQFVNAGFNPLQIISQKTGESMAVLRDKMSKGAISATMVEQAFQAATAKGGQFYNMTQKIAGTDFGKWEAFKGQVQGLSMELGGILAPIAGKVIKHVLMPMAEWVGRNQTLILTLGGAVLAYVAATRVAAVVTTGWAAATALYEIVSVAAATATGGWATAMAVLNAVMALNPVGAVILAITALVAAVVYCWNKFEGFRGAVFAVWDTTKFVFNNIASLAKAVFTNVAILANPVNWLNPALIKSAAGNLMNEVQKFGQGWAKAATSGYQRGVQDFRGGGKNSTISEFFGTGKKDGTSPASPAAGDVGLSSAKGKSGGATGAGKGITHITINIQQLGQTTIHATTVREGTDQMKEGVRQALLSVLNDANAMTTAS